jgi:universal stress protein E
MSRSIRRILVAVKDASQRSLPAVAKATQIARGTGASLELYHDIAAPVFVDTLASRRGELARVEKEAVARSTEQLERVAARVRHHGVRVSVCAEWDYPAYEAILRRAMRVKADLVVADSHDHHGARWILSYTDWELLRLAPMPVLLVKNPRPYRRPRLLVPVDPGHAHDKPARLDGTLLALAAALAGALAGEVHCVHAFVLPTSVMATFGTGAMVDLRRSDDRAGREAAARLRALAARHRIPAARRHFEPGTPVEVIPAVARATRASLVVMGAVSRTGVKRLLVGNTAERVLDRLPCDVLVAKPSGFRSSVPRKSRGMQLMTTPVMPGI